MRQAIDALTKKRCEANHPGLLLQRYLSRQEDCEERRALFGAVQKAARNETLYTIYTAAFKRRTVTLLPPTIQRAEELVTTGRLLVGLGSENVLETGLRLHHTYGVPIIPGSALKGLASHYCHEVWGQRHNDRAPEENRLFRRGEPYHLLIVGTTEDGGVITFHDAWITPASLRAGSIYLDVMTPHHPDWQKKKAAPTDFDSPVPVSFLSVAGTFEIRLSWSGPASTPCKLAEAWTELAMKLLKEALAEWGIGGKATSGYGRLVLPDSPRARLDAATSAGTKGVVLPKSREMVDARLLEERTNKGGWKAIHEPSGLSGPIQNSGDVPEGSNAGDMLKLTVAHVTKRELAFRYPVPADEKRTPRAPNKGKKGSGDFRRSVRRK